MKLTKDTAIITATKTIRDGVRHPDYKRTIEVADLYYKLITGDRIDSLLIQFNPRENVEAFQQRKRITKLLTPAFASSVMKPFYKVPKTDRVVKKIIPKSKTDTSLVDDIQNKMDLFYGSDNEEGGLDFWLKNRFVELSFVDPNTFIVIEFDEFDAKETTPNAYPFEVSSDMAVNFEIENNNVDWLISMECIQYITEIDNKGNQKTEAGYKYTLYAGEFSMVFRQITDNKKIQKLILLENETVMKMGDKLFAVSEYDTKLEDWQMFRIGYNRDLQTKGRTFVNPFHAALCHFETSIKSVSEFNLTNATHVFPQKMAYVSSCPGEVSRDPEQQDPGCSGGRTRAGAICKVCNGTGARVHTSSQDIITFPLPESKDDMFPLKDMMAYFAPPIELLTFQSQQIDKFEPLIHQAVFNTTVLVQKTVVATATEKDQDMDSVYDTLTPFANKSAAVYLNVANAIAVLIGYEGKVNFVFRYPSDFKMKSRQTLYTELKTINDSGAPSFVKKSVEDDLADQVFIDDPEGKMIYTVKNKFQPFTGKTTDEVLFLLSSSLTPERNKVLYANFEEIMSEADLNNKNFYLMKYAAQKTIIDAIVQRYIDDLTPKAPTLPPITDPNNPSPADPNNPAE